MADPAVIFANPTGVIRYWNSGMTDLFGFTEDDALGATLDLIVPPDYRERHWIGYRAAMNLSDGVVDHGSFNVPALHKDGHTIRLEVHLNVIHDSRGQVLGAFSAFTPDQGPSESIEPL
ncbi:MULTISPECIES: PAS domain-containing protein [unclassified Kribbella]|uniref:PAS domain-containing protein n=1 Tax=unclassified Kribbella TaxID=2644121 RepID=UPI003409CD6C